VVALQEMATLSAPKETMVATPPPDNSVTNTLIPTFATPTSKTS